MPYSSLPIPVGIIDVAAEPVPPSKSKRTRTRRPKVKTGCFTCKTRHLKCDETKPQCFNCTKTGRQCDGYPRENFEEHARPPCFQSDEQIATQHLLKLAASWSRSSVSSPLSIVGYGGDLQELRSTQYFLERISKQFSVYHFEKDFWDYLVPQISHALPMVSAAASALVSIHEICCDENKADLRSTHIELACRQGSFLRHYGAAITQMHQQLCDQPDGYVPVLITCVLLMCIELIRGKAINALTHLQGGFAVLRTGRASSSSPGSPYKMEMILKTTAESLNSNIVENDLSHLFRRLDVQSSSYITMRGPELPTYAAPEAIIPMTLTHFQTLQDASRTLTSLMHSCYKFTSSAAQLKYQPRAAIPSTVFDEHRKHLASLDSWLLCLGQSIARRSSPAFTAFDPATTLTASVLAANCHATYIYTSCVLSPFETAYDDHFSRFSAIISHAASALAQISAQSPPIINESKSPFFTPEPGVVQPLYFTATRFRHPALRRQAIELLRSTGKEGPWDGQMVASVATKVVELEESLTVPGSLIGGEPKTCSAWDGDTGIPSTGVGAATVRFHGVGIHTDKVISERKVGLECSYLNTTALANAREAWSRAASGDSLAHVGEFQEIDLRDRRFWLRWRGEVDL